MKNELRKRLELLKARARRLEELRRAAGSGEEGTGTPAGPEADRVMRRTAPERRESQPLPLEAAVPGRVCETAAGPCYLACARGETLDGRGPGVAPLFERLVRQRGLPSNVFGSQLRGIHSGGAPEPASFAFYDIETAGLSPSTYLFLCGVLSVRDGAFEVEQILARDYPEERAALHRLCDVLGRARFVVTFNGRSFDMPFTRTRMAVHRIDFEEEFTALDLLGPTRKAFAHILPNCRLGTVEHYLTGKERTGDVPGREIPGVYHEFVRTGDARTLAGVLYHNRMDLLTMVIILNQLWQNAGS